MQALREAASEKGMEPPKIGSLELTQQILKSEGISGLFHGLRPTFAREMPGYFCFFFAYEYSRDLLTPPGKKSKDSSINDASPFLQFLISAIFLFA